MVRSHEEDRKIQVIRLGWALNKILKLSSYFADRKIDPLVYGLYSLTEEEIKIVEGS